MCGILGQISFDKSNDSLPDLTLLRHRGPDASGEWMNLRRNVYFGHTRLSILEPTPAGEQPMQDSSGRFTIIFNGEIYNHLTLRELLPNVKWRGNSDTETLVELLAIFELETLELIKGMFAFALHDNADDSILLVRDRLGIKPLWYRNRKKKFRFSSELRALIVQEEVKVSESALSEYVSFGRMPAEGEIIDGIQALPPGSWIKVKSNGTLTYGKWWPMVNLPHFSPRNRSGLAKQIKQIVTNAIEEHLISDVGIGSFLSGGIDSSIVTLVAGKALGDKLKTFTIGFPQEGYDERTIARKVAIRAGSDHRELEINMDTCLNWVKEAVTNLDLPSVDAINTFIVSKAVRDAGLKVALSGLGGDELFGGYPSFRSVPLLKKISFLPPKAIKTIVRIMPRGIKDKLEGLESFSVIDLAYARRRFTSIAAIKKMGLSNIIPTLPLAPSSLDMMGQISWAEIYGYMIPMLLRDSDQMSMAVGLEIRVPFLDHHLVEKVLSLSQNLKSGPRIKSLLIECFIGELPKEVYNRPKQGFALPMDDWIRGSLADFAREGVMAAAELLSMPEPLQQYKEFHKGNLHWTRIWSWCVLGHWLSRLKESHEVELV